MPERQQLPSLIKITAAFVLVILTTVLIATNQGIAQDTPSAINNSDQLEAKESLPADLMAALSLAHGNYETLISMQDLLEDLQAVDIVLIGEAHYDRQDMQTAFEIIRLLAQRRRIALAVERFPLSLQPDLDALYNLKNEVLRSEGMKTVLQSGDYQTIWGINQSGQSVFADPNELVYPVNSPSADVYEEMMLWAACERIPIIGMDLPFSERESGLGENIPYRNGIWKDQIVNFLAKHQSADYLVVAIGGIDHLNNAPDSVQDKLNDNPSALQFLSIGQRDANFPSKKSQHVEDLAMTYQVDNLILRDPQYAVVKQDDSAIFPTPPDYWIAVHSIDGRDKFTGCSLN
jgi:hypothetical protein